MINRPPYYQRGPVRLYRGNLLEVLPDLAAASCDAVVTDPPYSSGGSFRGDRISKDTSAKYANGKSAYGEFAGDTRDQRSFAHWCALWLAGCLRVAKPGSVAAVFTDWRQLPSTTDALQAGGWVWRGVGVWDKVHCRPNLGRFRSQCEYVPWGTHGARPLVGACLPGLWRHPSHPSGKLHLAGKPLELMKELVAICPPGGVVLDPFLGSGTTMVACVLTGRRCIGVEIDERYCNLAAHRVGEALDVLPATAMAPANPAEQAATETAPITEEWRD